MANHIQEIAAKGRSCFVFDVVTLKHASPLSIKAALHRLHKKVRTPRLTGAFMSKILTSVDSLCVLTLN